MESVDRRAHDEQGSALVFALVMIIIIAVAGAAVLTQISAAGRAQNAYTNQHASTLSVENTAETLADQMRNSRKDAIDNSNASNTCSNNASWQQIAPNVFCKPDFQAGLNLGTTPDPPPYSVLTLGGSNYTGNRVVGGPYASPPYPVTNASGFANGSAPYYAPFCDNFHDFQDVTTTSRCEASLFVGRQVVTDDTGSGGLTIASNGNVTSAPVVRVNGSIVLSDAQNGGHAAVLHTLTAAGIVQARRMCGWGHGYLDRGGLVDGPSFASEILGGVDTTHPNGVSTSVQCDTDNLNNVGADVPESGANNVWTNSSWNLAPDPTTLGANPVAPPTPTACNETSWTHCMWSDPDWVHEPFDPTTPSQPNSLANVPRVDASASGSYQLNPALCAGGFVPMPAKDTGKTMSWVDASNVTQTAPVYTAWYDNAADLSGFMNDPKCDDTTFWFRPGVYYFDFLDVQHSSSPTTKWTVPNGCIPICSRGGSEVISGTPTLYMAGGAEAGWKPCPGGAPGAAIDTTTCVQPWKPMSPNTFSTAQGGNASGFGVQDTNGEFEALDGPETSPPNVASISLSGSFTNDDIQSSDFGTPIPQNSGTGQTNVKSVDGVLMEVAYNLPSTNNPSDGVNYCGSTTIPCYKDPSAGSNANNDGTANTTGQGQGAELQIQLGGTGAGTCFVHLPTGDHSRLTTSYPNPNSPVFHGPSYPAGTGSITAPPDQKTATYPAGDAIVIDLSKGCNSSIPGFEKAQNGCVAITGGNCFPTAAGGWNLHPDWVNHLQTDFAVRTTNTLPGFAKITYDGVQQDAKWTGRPAPTFADGCQTAAPGVQWVFGNASRLDWSGTSDDTYAELCTSKQSLYPGVDPAANGASYGVGIYGMSEDSAGPPPIWYSKNVAPGTVQINANSSGDVPFPQAPATTNASASYPIFGTIDASMSGAAAGPGGPPDVAAGKSVGVEWNTKYPASLAFKFPDNVWKWTADKLSDRPYGSFECGLTAPLSPTDVNDPPVVGAEVPNDGSCGANTIPYGSVITNVTLKVRHREGRWSAAPAGGNGTVPTSGSFSSCSSNPPDNASCIKNVSISINPGPGTPGYPSTVGSGATGSNGAQIAPWSTGNEVSAALLNTTLPVSDASTPTGWRDWAWGVQTPDETTSIANGNPATSDWSFQRDLTDSLSSPEALAGALITISVLPKDDSTWHYAELDGLALEVTYRPAGTARPLNNCLTTRTAWPPSTLEGVATAGAVGWTQVGGKWVYNGGGHDWLDQDWGIYLSNGGRAYQGDQALGNLSASSAGNGTGDTGDCALVNIDGSKNHTRFHIAGTMYAPSAGIALSGYSNDAPWASDGIVARQLSALRWKRGGNVTPIGDGFPTPGHPRTATIVVCDPNQTWNTICTGSDIRLRTKVQFNDSPRWGYAANTVSWTRNPGS